MRNAEILKVEQRSMNPVTIERLGANGSDLSAGHRIVNVFHMPHEHACQLLCAELLRSHHDLLTEGSPPGRGGDDLWLVESLVILLPTVAAINNLTDACVDMADRFGGVYDGWYTDVIPQSKD